MTTRLAVVTRSAVGAKRIVAVHVADAFKGVAPEGQFVETRVNAALPVTSTSDKNTGLVVLLVKVMA